MTAVAATPETATDLAAVKARQQAAWSTGDYAVVGTTLQIVGENLCEALDLRSGSRVLDVAAGNGNATLAAARRWCEVVSTDYVPGLLEAGRARDAAEIRVNSRNFVFRYTSPDHWIEVFRTYYGPMNRTYAALDAVRQAELTRDMLALIARDNRAADGTVVLPSEYLEVVIRRR